MIAGTGPTLSGLAVAAFTTLSLLVTPTDLEAQGKGKGPPPRGPYNHDRANIAPQSLQQTNHSWPAEARAVLASQQVAAALEQSSLTMTGGTRLPAEVQHALLSVLRGADGASARLAERLAPEHNQAAAAEAHALVTSLQRLLAEPAAVGEAVTAYAVGEAVTAYNALIDASTEEFLRAPPVELLAVRTVLAYLLEGGRPSGR